MRSRPEVQGARHQDAKDLTRSLVLLLEGHSYSICDRRFGSIQRLFDTHEVIEFPRQWAIVLERSHLKDVRTYWVTLNMIKDAVHQQKRGLGR